MLIVEPSNLVFLKTYNTEFDEIIITFTNQNDRPLEMNKLWTFSNINRLFILPLRNGDNDPTRDSFEKYDMPFVEIKDFNALIDNKPFFDQQ